MDGNLSYLFAAYTILWLIIFFYIFSIGKGQKDLKNEIENLKEIVNSER